MSDWPNRGDWSNYGFREKSMGAKQRLYSCPEGKSYEKLHQENHYVMMLFKVITGTARRNWLLHSLYVAFLLAETKSPRKLTFSFTWHHRGEVGV